MVHTLLKGVVAVVALVQVQELVAALVAEPPHIKEAVLPHKQVLVSLRATVMQVDRVAQHGLVLVAVVQVAQA